MIVAIFGLVLSIPASPGAYPRDLRDWVSAEPPEAPGDRWWAARNDVKYEWVLSLRDGRPIATNRRQLPKRADSLPFKIAEDNETRGSRRVVRVMDGWIISFNRGEFGAAVWWFSTDGRRSEKIGEFCVEDFVSMPAGVYILEGLSHGTEDWGRILRLWRTPDGRWRAQEYLALGHKPRTFQRVSEHEILIATRRQLLRVDLDEPRIRVLTSNAFWDDFYPSSMVETRNGDIYLGMRHGIAWIEKGPGSGKLRWLIPDPSFDHQKLTVGFR